MDRSVYQNMAAVEDHHWWFRGRARVVERAIERIVGQRPTAPLAILDAGCGTGGNLAMLTRFGDVTGFELDAEAADFANARGTGARVLVGGFPEATALADLSFDLVVMTDVLEHIREDEATLVRIRALLRPGGSLLATVPAYPWLWSEHDELHHHHRRYRERELIERVERAGLRVRYRTSINTWLCPLVVLARLVSRGLRRRGARGLGVPPRPVNALLRMLFASERHLIGRLRLCFGTSLLVVATREP